MSTDLEERLRRHYRERTDGLPVRGPGLPTNDRSGLIVPTVSIASAASAASVETRRVRTLVGVAAASIAVLGVGALATFSGGSPSESQVSLAPSNEPMGSATATPVPAASTTTLAAPSTAPATFPPENTAAHSDVPPPLPIPPESDVLPSMVDLIEVPVTVAAGASVPYWRFLPDLDIGWRATSTGTELCWRTMAGEGCVDDDFGRRSATTVVDLPTPGGLILLTRSSPVIEVVLSDGSQFDAIVEYRENVDIGFARLTLDPGISLSDATAR